MTKDEPIIRPIVTALTLTGLLAATSYALARRERNLETGLGWTRGHTGQGYSREQFLS